MKQKNNLRRFYLLVYGEGETFFAFEKKGKKRWQEEVAGRGGDGSLCGLNIPKGTPPPSWERQSTEGCNKRTIVARPGGHVVHHSHGAAALTNHTPAHCLI